MKRIISITLALALIFTLCGCGHQHTWSEASCTAPKTCSDCGETEGEALEHSFSEASCAAPKTCSVCGETEGEALAHSFSEASCAAPKTCSVCGETEGEPLGHQLIEANYQSAARCTVCGETEGEALTPDFEKYGITADLEVGVTRNYNTITGDESLPVVAKATLLSHDIIDSNEECAFREGYKWHLLTFSVLFDDENARKGGANIDYTVSDYYNIPLFVDKVDHSDPTVSVYTVNFNGEDKFVYFSQRAGFEPNENGDYVFTFNVFVQAPEGYDGIVIGIQKGNIDTRHGAYLNDVYTGEEDFLLYRIVG